MLGMTGFTARGPQEVRGCRLLTSRDGLYGQLKVCDVYDSELMLLIDSINQGSVSKTTGESASRYPYAVEALAEAACPAAKNALVVGLGAGLVPNALIRRGISPEVVEIDPLVAKLYHDYFNLNRRQFPVHLADAREFVRNCQASYDLIVMDAFSGDTVPAHLLAREAFAEFAQRLADDGALILNFIVMVGESRCGALPPVLQTMRQVFPQVQAFCWHRVDGPPAVANVLILALKTPRRVDADAAARRTPAHQLWYVSETVSNELQPPLAAVPVLTDDHNSIDLVMTKSAEAWRRSVWNGMDRWLLLR
jgi:spermidine synthase